MILLVIGSLVTACLALLQGIHTIRTGTMQPFFDQSRDIPPYLTAAATVAYGMVYCLPSMALLAILAFSLSRNLRRATAWLGGHVGVAGACFLLLYGLVALLRPDVILGWIQSSYRDQVSKLMSSSSERFVRVLGFLAIVAALEIFNGM